VPRVTELSTGYTRLYLERHPLKSLGVLRRMGLPVAFIHSRPGLKTAAERLPDCTELWISRSGDIRLNAVDVELPRAVQRAQDSAAFVEGVALLGLMNGWRTTLKTLKKVCDICTEHRIHLVVSVNPDAVEDRALASMEKMFDAVTRSTIVVRDVRGAGALIVGDRMEIPDGVERVYTTMHPERFSSRHEFTGEVHWISSGSQSGFSPGDLNFRLMQHAMKCISGGGTVMFHGVHQLMLEVDMRDVLSFFKNTVDAAHRYGGMVYASLSPEPLDTAEVEGISECFDSRF